MQKLSIFFLFASYLFITGSVGAQSTITSTSGNIDWSSPSSWVGGNVPAAGDNVLIAASTTVTIANGSAACNNISFADNTAKLALTSPTSALSVNGDFSFATTTHVPFSGWTAGAKLRFVGTATQTIQVAGGTPTTASGNYSIMELEVDKASGILTTAGNNSKLCVGSSINIIRGTLRLAADDDIFGRDLSGTAAMPTISVQTQGLLTNLAGATQVNAGTASISGPIGKMTIYGNVEISSSSTAGYRFNGIDIESGGTLRFISGFGSSPSIFPGAVVCKSGGTIRYSTTSSTFWGTGTTPTPATSVIMNSGSFMYVSVSPDFTLPANFTDNGATWRFVNNSNQNIPARSYTNIEFSGTGITATKTVAAGTTTVNGTLTLLEAATLSGTGIVAYGPTGSLQYGASGETITRTSIGAEWPTANGPQNVRVWTEGGVTLNQARTIPGTLTLTNGIFTIGGNLTMGSGATISRARGSLSQAPTFGGPINLAYTSTLDRVTTSFEVPSSNTINDLTVSSSMGIILGTSLTATGILNFAGTSTGTQIEIQNNNLTASTISSTGSGYVQTNGTGVFTLKNLGSTSALFPVGNSAYNPVTITNNSGLAGDFSVRVIDEVYNSGSSTGSLMTGPRVRRTWMIAKSNANGGSGVNFNFNWNPTEVAGSLPTPALYNYTGGSWIRQTGSTSSTATSLNYTSFTGTLSSFAIGDNTTPLPVLLSSFSAIKVGKNNLLSWATASEQNNAGFEVQRSTDGSTYEKIGFVKSLSATGNSSSPLSYSFTDFNPLGLQQYYRLKQTDLDGKSAYSAIVLVKREAPATLTVTKVYPNPSTSSIYINAACPAATTLQLSIVDMNGRVVGRKQVNAMTGNNGFDMPVTQLAPGTYLLQVLNADNKVVTTEKFIKQ
jgi:hypothetical protein